MKNSKNKFEISLKKTGGRNNAGKMTVYTIGGGVKRKYRLIDFYRSSSVLCLHHFAFVMRIERDASRSAYVALVCYPNGILSYILATEKMQLGNKIYNFNASNNLQNFKIKNPFSNGNSFFLKDVPSGNLVNTIELYPKMGGVLNRAAGTYAQIITKYNADYIQLKLKSGEHRIIHKDCRATLGTISNITHSQKTLVKAGQSRLLGKRPIVRGRAMNPVDHPHGGRTNGGTVPKTPWEKLTKGKKTRNNLTTGKFVIIRRVNRNKKRKKNK